VAEAAEEAIPACLAAGAAADSAVNWPTGLLPLGGVSTRCGGGAAATVTAVGFDRAARRGIWLSHSTVRRRRHWQAAPVRWRATRGVQLGVALTGVAQVGGCLGGGRTHAPRRRESW